MRKALRTFVTVAQALSLALCIAPAAISEGAALTRPALHVQAMAKASAARQGQGQGTSTAAEQGHDAILFCLENGLFRSDSAMFSGTDGGVYNNAADPMSFSDCRTAIARLRLMIHGTPESVDLPHASGMSRFESASYVNREQFVSMLTAAAEIVSPSLVNDIDEVPGGFGWTDSGKAILGLYRAGILIGDEHGYFSPFRPITQAEAATILMRFFIPASRVRIDPPFSADASIFLREVSIDPGMLAGFFSVSAERRSVEFHGDSICLKTFDGNTWQQAIYRMDGTVAVPKSPTYATPGSRPLGSLGPKTGVSDGVLLAETADGTFNFFDLEGYEISTGKPIYDATPFNEGYAAVRHEESVSGPVQVIDKKGNRVADLPGGYLLHKIHPSSGIVHGFASHKLYPTYSPSVDVLVVIETGEKIDAIAKHDDSVTLTSNFKHGFARASETRFGTHDILGGSVDLVDHTFNMLGFNLDSRNHAIVDWNSDFVIVSESRPSVSDTPAQTGSVSGPIYDMALMDADGNVRQRIPASKMRFADILGMPDSTIVATRYADSDAREHLETAIGDASGGRTLSIAPSSATQIENCLVVDNRYSYSGSVVAGMSRSVTDIFGNRLSPVPADALRYVEPNSPSSVDFVTPSENTDPEKTVNNGMLVIQGSRIFHLKSDRIYKAAAGSIEERHGLFRFS